jgi:hypothetical protein
MTSRAGRGAKLRGSSLTAFDMSQTLHDLIGFDPRDIAGTRVSGEIPLPDVMLNRLIAAQLAATRGKVAAVVLETREANQVAAHVRVDMPFVPPLVVNLEVAQQPEFPALPVVVFRWSLAGLDGLARMAMPFVSAFLPPWARINGDLIAVDIQALAQSKGVAELLNYVRSLRVDTAAGRLVVRFELGVEERGGPPT